MAEFVCHWAPYRNEDDREPACGAELRRGSGGMLTAVYPWEVTCDKCRAVVLFVLRQGLRTPAAKRKVKA